MTRKLIFLDIDGTLTPPGSNVPPAGAVEAIRKAREKGHRVFLCSGRNPGMLAPLLAYGFDGYVGSGGGYVVCGDKVLYDCPMTKEQQETGMRLLREAGVFRTVEARDEAYGDSGMAEFLNRTSGGLDYDLPLVKQGDVYVCGDGSASVEIGTTSGNIRINALAD